MEIGPHVDIDALIALGYKTATIDIACDIRATSGKQHIVLLSEWPDSDKQIDSITLFNSGKLDYANKEGHSTSYSVSINVPIENIGSEIYVAYKADGLPIKNDTWTSDGMEIKLTFAK